MIIDAHNHPDWHGHDLEKFITNMKEFNIDKCWLMSTERPKDEYQKSSAYSTLGPEGPIPFSNCIKYAEKFPDKFILGYSPDPRKPEAIDMLESAISMYGVKIYGELKLRMMYDNLDAIRLFKYCGEKGLPVVVHIDYEIDNKSRYPRPNWWFGGGIEAFERAVKACPYTNFVGHAPGFWAHISGDDQYLTVSYPKGSVLPNGKIKEMFDKYPNLYCDISAGSGLNALKRDPSHALEFLDKYRDRIMYARDCFTNEHQEFLNSLDLGQDIKDKIFYMNSLKLVNMDQKSLS